MADGPDEAGAPATPDALAQILAEMLGLDPSQTWNQIQFANSGVRFTCFAPLWWTAH